MLPRRLTQLYAGLALYGVSGSFILLSGLGNDPWDVFHQGLSRAFGLSIGTWVILIGVLVLLLWIPLRQRPGIGTISNVILIGVWLDLTLRAIPVIHPLPVRVGLMVGGIVLCGIATGLYIGAAMGPGPRDGLMVGIANRGHSIRVVRTSIEVIVLIAGWLLGGTVGIGTVLYALTIGLIAHVTIPAFARGPVLRAREPEQDVERTVEGRPVASPVPGEVACASD
jgi:uncharacterized membrane protein YczE